MLYIEQNTDLCLSQYGSVNTKWLTKSMNITMFPVAKHPTYLLCVAYL